MIDREALARMLRPTVPDIEHSLRAAGAALQALDTAGYCIAPKEATDEMVRAAYDVEVMGADLFDFEAHDCAPDIWQAMVAKAQEPQS